MSSLFDFEDDDWSGTFRSQSVGPELAEDQKDQYRSVAVPKPTHYDLLKQAIKKKKNAGIYLESNYYDKLTKRQKLSQKIYRVQRRKDIIKDYYSLFVDNGKGLTDRNIVKNFRQGVQYLRKLRIRLDQLSKPEMMTNWIRILQGKHLSKLKTLVLDPSCADILAARGGRFPLFRSKPSNLENLKIILNQMHGGNDIPIQDFTLRLIRGIHKLKHLCFDVYACAFMKDEHLDVMGKALRSQLHHLESLEMRFEALSLKTTAKGVASLWKSLDKIPNLKKLELAGSYSRGHYGGSVIDYETFVILCDVIQTKSTSLTTLKLDLGSLELGYDAHKYLCKSLVDLLPRLHQLELKFNGKELISDDSLPLLGDLLGNGSNFLKILTLDFYSCNRTTSKGAQGFAEKLKRGSFPAVETLWIYFHYIPKLQFEGLYAIAEAVSVAFPNIKDLTFGFQRDPRRYSDHNYEFNDSELQIKAETMLKEKLKNLPKNFRLYWSE